MREKSAERRTCKARVGWRGREKERQGERRENDSIESRGAREANRREEIGEKREKITERSEGKGRGDRKGEGKWIQEIQDCVARAWYPPGSGPSAGVR